MRTMLLSFPAHVALGTRTSDNHQMQRRVRCQQPRQAFNHTMEALALYQRADRNKHFRIYRQAELPSRVLARDGSEPRQIDAVANHLHAHRVCTVFNGKRLQGGGYRNQLIGAVNCPFKCSSNVSTRLTRLLAAQREHDRQLQPTSQQNRRIAVRVTEVGIDDIGVDARVRFDERRNTTTAP